MGGDICKPMEFKKLADLISYFAETSRYGLLDRMAMALSPESVEAAIYDMMRLINTEKASRIIVRIKSPDNKSYKISCCQYGEAGGGEQYRGITGVVEEVLSGPKELGGKTIYCIPCPPTPTIDEINEFLECVQRDPGFARKVVILGLSHTRERRDK